MIVEDLRMDGWDDTCEVSARIRNSGLADDGQRIWFRFPAELAPAQLDGSPYLPAFLQACMTLGEPLTIDAPVSPRLLEEAERAQELHRAMFVFLRDRHIRVEASEAREPAAGGREAACFFTRGVDSWYSALNGIRGAPHALDPPVTKLLWAPTLDYFAGRPSAARAREVRARATELTREAAEQIGCELVVADSNARELVDPYRDWSFTHGALLASMGLAMGNHLARVHIASTLKSDNLVPLGSHPDLDPLWSTEATTIVHDGADVTRVEKERFLAGHPVALERLKVCINQTADSNCGKCGKCVRTMIGLELAGALDRGPSFDAPLRLRNIAAVVPDYHLAWAFHHEVSAAVKRSGGHRGIRAALYAAKVKGFLRELRPHSWKERLRLIRLKVRPASSVR